MDEVSLEVENSGLEALAEEAMERGTGARALRSIFEKLMLDIMFAAPEAKAPSSVKIDRKVVEGEQEPEIVTEKKSGEEKEAA